MRRLSAAVNFNTMCAVRPPIINLLLVILTLSLGQNVFGQTSSQERSAAARSLLQEGRKLEQSGNRQDALLAYRKALTILRVTDEPYGYSVILNNVASIYADLNDFPQAMLFYKKVLEIRLKLGGPQGAQAVAAVRANIGQTYLDMKQFRNAMIEFDNALKLIPHGNEQLKATIYNNKGQAYQQIGENSKAAQEYRRAQELFENLKEPCGIGRALNNLASLQDSMGEKTQAVQGYESAIKYWRACGNKVGLLTSLTNLGQLYAVIGMRQDASRIYRDALKLASEMDVPSEEALLLSNLAQNDFYSKRYEEAERGFQAALKIYQRIRDFNSQADIWSSFAGLAETRGQPKSSLEYLQKALPLYVTAENREGQARVLHNMCGIRTALGEFPQAAANCHEALAIHRSIQNLEGEAITLGLLASAHRNSRPGLSVWYLKLALQASQKLRENAKGLTNEQRQSLDGLVSARYLNGAQMLLRAQRNHEAQQVLDLLKEAENFEYTRPASLNYLSRRLFLNSREKTAAVQLETYLGSVSEASLQLRALKLNTEAVQPTSQRKIVEARIGTAMARLRQFLAKLETDAWNNQSDPLALAAIPEAARSQELLRNLEPGTAIVYSVLFPGNDYRALLITRKGRQSFSPTVADPKVGPVDIDSAIDEFRSLLRSPVSDVVPSARRLHDLLLPQELRNELDLQKIQHVLWVPHGRLRYLPFSALHDGSRYLALKYRNSLFSPGAEEKILAADTKSWSGIGFGASKGGEGFSPLPAVEEELKSIFSPVGSRAPVQGRFLLDRDFTRQALLNHRCNCNVVHIATHFASRPGDPTSSVLLLGDGSELTLAELEKAPGLFAGVELVALSACETATGNQTADGREVDSLANVMKRLGAKAILASLWSVNDKSTALFMQEFYRDRQANPGQSKVEALYATQKAMIEGKIKGSGCAGRLPGGTTTVSQSGYKCEEDRPYSHPFYWAPFVLMGNWK